MRTGMRAAALPIVATKLDTTSIHRQMGDEPTVVDPHRGAPHNDREQTGCAQPPGGRSGSSRARKPRSGPHAPGSHRQAAGERDALPGAEVSRASALPEKLSIGPGRRGRQVATAGGYGVSCTRAHPSAALC